MMTLVAGFVRIIVLIQTVTKYASWFLVGRVLSPTR